MLDTTTARPLARSAALPRPGGRLLTLALPPARRARPAVTRYRTVRPPGLNRRQRYLPTPIPAAEPPAAEPPAQRRIDLSRWRLTLHLLRWILSELLCRLLRIDPQRQRSAHFNRIIRRFGGVWLLLGQALSSQKSHYHSKDLAKQFGALPPIGMDDIQTIIAGAFGRPLDSIFAEFNPRPIAVGEFSVIYRARLRREQVEVAVKLQRPETAAAFARDKPALGLIRALLGLFRISPHVHWAEQFREIEQIIQQQQDYRYEAASTDKVRKLFKKYKIWVPRVYEQYSKNAILTSEYVPAPSLQEFLDFRARDPQEAEKWLRANNIALPRFGQRLFDRMLRQSLEENLFHVDPCPHDTFLLRDNRIAMLDLNITSVDKQFLNIYTIALRALSNSDYDQAADLVLLMCEALPVVDIAEVKGDLVRCFRAYAARSDLHKMPYHEKGIDVLFLGLGQVLYRHQIQWGWQIFKIWRSMAALDLTMDSLGSDKSFLRLLKRYFRKSARRRLRQLYADGLASPLLKVAGTLSEMLMFQTASLRRTARVYQSTIGKVEYAGAVLLSSCARALLGAALVGLWVYLYQHQRAWLAPLEGTWPVELVKDIQVFPRAVWGLALALAVYTYFTLRRLSWRLMQKEVRL